MKKTIRLFSLVLSVLLVGCHGEKKLAEPSAPAPRVEGDKVILPADSPQLAMLTIAAAKPHKANVLHFSGRLTWDDNVTVRVFSPVAGRVRRVVVDIGQQVAKGANLALLDSPDYGQAQADGRKAASDLALKERTLARVQELFKNGAAAEKDLLSAKADQEAAVFENQRTAARLTLYGGNTNFVDGLYHLITPLGGTVVERNVSHGQEIRADQMLANAPEYFAPHFVVTNPAKMWVRLDVPEAHIPRMKPGEKLVIHTSAYPDQTFSGRLDIVGESLDPLSRTVKVRGSVDNSQRLLKSEMYATVELDEDRPLPGGAAVPSKAVFAQGEKYFVFVEEAPGRFAKRAVTVGREYDGHVSVREGLKAGERVVTEGCLLLQNIFDLQQGS